MGKVARAIRLSVAGAGLAALLAGCQTQLNDQDRALLMSAQESARKAEAAAGQAQQAADRATAAAAEAADAASSAQLAAERQDRMLQKTMRK